MAGWSLLRRLLHAVSVGIWLGASAGTATAFSDFGAHWLFMESATDRVALLLRLLSTQVPAAAALGGSAGLVYGCAYPLLHTLLASQADRPMRRIRMQRAGLALVYALLLTPATHTLARLLFTGGHMQRLHARAPLQALSFVVLSLGVFVTLYVVHALLQRARAAGRGQARALALVVFCIGFAACKLDQLYFPNLYDYLHGSLSLLSVAAFALALALFVARSVDAEPTSRALRYGGLLLALPLVLAFQRSVLTLDQNQNVRVALLSANVPHSRSLLLGITPLLPRADAGGSELARQRASQARATRARGGGSDQARNLPTQPGAHLLLITIDALRADHLGTYGYARHITPELDALAAQGVVFERAYTQAPHSSYSLCSIMTSEYLHETLDLGQAPPHDTLPRALTQAGYHTAAFYTQGIFHTAGEKLAVYENDAFGFALHDHQDRPAEATTDRVLAEFDRTLARGEPSSFTWAHYFDVHEPYEATTLGTSDMDRYDSEILATDRAIGRLVRESRRRLKKDLIVVITADHGEEFHDHGGVYHGSSVYEEQVRVPFIVLAKALPAARVSAPIESIDLAPTVLGLLDVDKPAHMRGVDLRALALGKSKSRGPVFSAVIHKKMVVSWPYKLVADLRFALFELYDLSSDPKERDNLADRDKARVQALRGEVYAWLDSLSPTDASAQNPSALALEWGRLGDRRAVKPLSKLMLDENEPTEMRSEAARLLGKLADPRATGSLLEATRSHDAWVAAEAAIALGRLFEPRAAPKLRGLVDAEDPSIRSRAAVSLGRLRDVTAVPALIDALWIAPNTYEREEAIRWVGRLRDVRALDPLINLLPEAHMRHLVVVALGDLGDARALPALAQVLAWDRNTNVRDGVVRAMGALGDPRALPVLVPVTSDDPALANAGESLVRLEAIGRGYIGGTDITRDAVSTTDFESCYVGPLRHDWDYVHRTHCQTAAASAQVPLRIPDAVAQARNGVLVSLSIQRADSVASAELQLSIGDQLLSPVRVDGAWSELRWSLPKGAISAGAVSAVLRASDPAARFRVDQILILPRTSSESLAAHGG